MIFDWYYYACMSLELRAEILSTTLLLLIYAGNLVRGSLKPISQFCWLGVNYKQVIRYEFRSNGLLSLS